MSEQTAASVSDYGDAGLLVHVEGPDAERRWRVAQGLAGRLEAEPPVGLVDVVATYEDVLVVLDPLVTDHAAMTGHLRALLDTSYDEVAPREPQTFGIPVAYGGAAGPDLAEVAAELGLSADEVVQRHTGAVWTVRFRASPVGAPFLDGPRWPAPVPRMREPRVEVPAGSVALSGQQSMIYPVASPGGWRLIGRTPLRLIDLGRDGLVPWRAGDRLVFEAVEDG